MAHTLCPPDPQHKQHIRLQTVFAPYSLRTPAKTPEGDGLGVQRPMGYPIPLVVAACARGRTGAAWTAPQLVIHVLPETAARHLKTPDRIGQWVGTLWPRDPLCSSFPLQRRGGELNLGVPSPAMGRMPEKVTSAHRLSLPGAT